MTTTQPPRYPSTLTGIFPLQGGCACGLIRYSIARPPLVVNCCHCTSCQRETGTAFALNAFVPAPDLRLLPSETPTSIPLGFEGNNHQEKKTALPDVGGGIAAAAAAGKGEGGGVTKPDMILLPTESGMGQLAARCPACRVRVYCEYGTAGPSLKVVCVGTLDEAWKVEPDTHIFTASKRSFITLDDGKPQFEGVADREKVWRPESLERWRTSVLPEIKAYLKARRSEEATGGKNKL